MQDISNKISRYSWFVCVAVMCYTSFVFYPRWQQDTTERVISFDVSGYYWYLPSIFIYHDLKHQSFKDKVLAKYRPTEQDFQQATKAENGNYVMKYSSGMAVMYAPFFFAAHMAAGPLGYKKDGFSPPYQLAIQLGGFLVSILGLWYLRKLLLYFYSDAGTAISLLLLVAGTNYLELSSIDGGMSHTWLFTLYVFLLYNTYHFYKAPTYKYAIRIGLLCGLATLTRPTDVICCLIPLLWGMESIGLSSIKTKLTFISTHATKLLTAIACMVVVASVQLVYWKYVSGHWIVYSYGDQGFSFSNPNFRPYTFSFRSGWLIYTPMMMLAGIGIIPFLLTGKNNKVALIAFAAINYYIVCSWNIWNYGGRAMVQSYPVLLFFIAALADAALRKKMLLYLSLPLVLLFIYLNGWIIYQHHKGALYSVNSMTKPYYERVVGRRTAPVRTLELRDNPDLYEGDVQNTKVIYDNDFETDSTRQYVRPSLNGKHYMLLKANTKMRPISIPLSNNGMEWIRMQMTFNCDAKEAEEWRMAQMILKLKQTNEPDPNKSVKYNMIRIYRLLEDYKTMDISMDMKLPGEHYDSLLIWVDNSYSDKELVVDNIKVWGFNEFKGGK